MNKHGNHSTKEVAAFLIACDSSDKEEVFDVAKNQFDKDLDNVDTEPFKEDPDFSTYSESFNGSELEPDHDVHETIYTGNDNIKWGSTALSPAMYRQHNIIHVRARLAG